MKVKRIFELIKGIEKGEVICVKEYANRLGVDSRTMQRYLKELEEIFGIKKVLVKRGCYTFPKIKKIDFVDKDFEKIATIFSAFDKRVLKYFGVEKDVLNRLVDSDFLYVKHSPVEELMRIDLLKIKHAIKFKKVLEIEYKSDEFYKFNEFKPYKVVFSEGNWYLCGVSEDEINNGFKFLRINFIKSIKETPKTFKKDPLVESFIKNFDTLFSRFNASKFDVIVRVDREVARYFRVKKFHPTQKILEDNEDLVIKYSVSSDEEIILLAKRWLPYMKIISPKYLQDKLLDIVKEFVTKSN